jgi:hypothetical protein
MGDTIPRARPEIYLTNELLNDQAVENKLTLNFPWVIPKNLERPD